jgi:hypothetical protein
LSSLKDRPPGSRLSLHRRTSSSNTIRNASHKSDSLYFPVDLSSFHHILEINLDPTDNDNDGGVAGPYVICEPGILISDLVRELLRHGVTLPVVVELPGITIGGAISGGGLESSSWLHGQFMDTILELDCLTPAPTRCGPRENADLFYAISASYNTVALVTRVKIRLQRATRNVALRVERCGSWDAAAERMGRDQGADCIEGIAYSPSEIAVVRGWYTDAVAVGGDSDGSAEIRRFGRHWDRWYYKVIRDLLGTRAGAAETQMDKNHKSHPEDAQDRPVDRNRAGDRDRDRPVDMVVPLWDYYFRYNYGAFWMASYVLDLLGGDTLRLRLIIGWMLDTKHLFSVLHSSRLTDLGRMRIIQGFHVPSESSAAFLRELDQHVGVYPLWLCPVKGTRTPQYLACHHVGDPQELPEDDDEKIEEPTLADFINIGVYGRPRSFPYDVTQTNTHLVDMLVRFNARSMLYAQTWHTEDQWNAIYGGAIQNVERVKGKYGSDCFFGLYDKVALGEEEREELGVPMRGTEEEELRRVVSRILRSKLGWSR